MANCDGNQTLDPTTFPTPQALLHWLKPRLPSETVTLWGTKPGSKNVHNLWLDLITGKSTLSDHTNPPICRTEMVFVEIIGSFPNGKKQSLHESSRLLSDGYTQNYGGPLSKRMKPGESPKDAAHRAIKEELGSVLEAEEVTEIVRMVPEKYKRVEKETTSWGYPGLKARLVIHTLFAYVEGLPRRQFVTEAWEEFGDCSEFKEVVEKALRVIRRNWVWRRFEEDSLDSLSPTEVESDNLTGTRE